MEIKEEKLKAQNVPVVYEFSDLFFEQLPGLSP